MAQVTTVILLPSTPYPGPIGSRVTIVGSRAQAAAYYLSNNDLQTITWSVGQGNNYNPNNSQPNNTFTGIITIQASLITNPGDSDWFDVTVLDTTPLPQVGYLNLSGNFIWIRAKVSDWTGGPINLITASY